MVDIYDINIALDMQEKGLLKRLGQKSISSPPSTQNSRVENATKFRKRIEVQARTPINGEKPEIAAYSFNQETTIIDGIATRVDIHYYKHL